MIGFYGFNPTGFSRLFSPDVIQRGQAAFQQGQAHFKPYDPQELERLRAQRAAALSARNAQPVNNFLQGIGIDRTQAIGPSTNVQRVDQNRFMVTGAGQRGSTAPTHIYVDAQGNLLDGYDMSGLNENQFGAYNRLLAQLRGAIR